MGEFRFKKFSVVNERSAMKVNTDGVLLGALMTVLHSDRNSLDLGTGTGTVALMAAQRLSELVAVSGLSMCESKIVAIDIDEPSAEEAAENFRRSPWSDSLSACNMSLEDYAAQPLPFKFNHIFSNPPYFESQLRSPDDRRREARHCESMSYREIIDFAAARLASDGRLSLILPAEVENDLNRYARMSGLFPFRVVRIKTVTRKPPRRIVVELARERVQYPTEELLVMQEKGRYTGEYISLTSEFYLF